MRKLPFLIVAGVLAASSASAQSYGDNYYGDRDSAPRSNPPPAGADVAYDYLNHEYYRYDGPPPQAPAAREQGGYRDGHTEREPLTGYYSGVRLVYPGYYHRCGCYGGYYGYGGYGGRYGTYGHRGYYDRRDRYIGDDLDTQDYGSFSYNYSTRRYTDHHFGHGSWLW